MRHFLVVLLVITALVGSATVAFAATTTQGAANLHQFDGSGIKAKVQITDTGSTLTVTGQATGFAPGASYLSLFYDNGSIPSGPNACEPSLADNISFPQMFIGFWHNNGNGTGTLSATKAGTSYVSLDLVHTMSIRQDVNPSLPPGPARFQRRACGEVHSAD